MMVPAIGPMTMTMTAFSHWVPSLLAQMQTSVPPPGADYIRILPELVLSVFGMLIMVVDPLLDEENSHQSLGTIALIGTLAALASTFWMAQYPGTAFWNMVRVDGFSVFFHVLVIAIAAVAILSSFEYLRVQRIRAGEYYGLILFGTVGMCLMSSAIELVLIFIALEISSISTYMLAGFRRREASSSESSLKYFLLGSFATAFFLYGVALMFGATGSTNIDAINQALHSGNIRVPSGLCGDGAHVRGLGLQGRRCAFPCLDAGRLRRRASSGCRTDVNRPQGSGIRDSAARDVRSECTWTLLADLGLGRADHDAGKCVRPGAGQRQAPAGLFFDRARRVSAGRVCRTTRRTAGTGRVRGDVLHRCLCGDECRSVCRGQPLRERGRKVRHARRLRGLGQAISLCWPRLSRSS